MIRPFVGAGDVDYRSGRLSGPDSAASRVRGAGSPRSRCGSLAASWWFGLFVWW